MRWYNFRAIYLHGTDVDGTRVYEERLTLFQATDFDSAMALAEAESQEYLAVNPDVLRVGNWAAFGLHPTVETLHGVEAWSVLSESKAEPADYYRQRYVERELQPDHGDPDKSAG